MARGDFLLRDFLVHPDSDRLSRGATRIDLEPKTMSVLLALADRPGEVISSEELIRDVWHGRPMGENPVYKSIAKLRRALDDETGEPRFIETIPRKGYRLLIAPQLVASAPVTATVTATAGPTMPARSLTSYRKQIGIAAAFSIVLAAIVAWYAIFRTAESPASATTKHSAALSVYFPGLESDSVHIAAINSTIRERLAGLPGLAVSERAIDRRLASLRLTGSADSENGRLRVRLQLEGEDGQGLWSRQIDLPAEESYRIADQVAAAVQEAASLDKRKEKLAALPFAALQFYLQARTELGARRPGFAARMMAASREVLHLAPDSAVGHAALAIACSFESGTVYNTPAEVGHRECARAHAALALELDPELAEAHAAAGLVDLTAHQHCREDCVERQWRVSAQQSLERAVRLDPTLPEARAWLGIVYMDSGDIAHAIEQWEAALALDPLSPNANNHVGVILMARGNNEIARERLMRLARAQDMPWYVYQQLAEIALATGNFAEAQSWARRTASVTGSRWSTLAGAAILARSGDSTAARELYERAMADPTPISAYSLFYAVRVQQRLGGPAAVRRMIDQQLARLGTPADVPDMADRDLRIFVGWALALADDPVRALPWFESTFGKSGVPATRYTDIEPEAEGLLAYAWASERAGDTARARVLAQSTLDFLAAMASAGLDQNTSFALAQALALKLAGRHAEAIAELERAYALGWAEPDLIRADPRWSNFDAEPAVRALLARVEQRAPGIRIATAR